MESGNASENTIGELQLQPVVAAAETTVVETRKVAEKRKSRRASTKGRVSKKIKQEDEDVCFVCLNGGDLILCDFKCCPKAYHLECIKKEKDFLTPKMRWICGWHLCTTCLKSPAQYMCYTCTVSYCKKCVKDAAFVCVRGKYGFCSPCLKSVMQIEVQDDGNKDKMEVDFDDEDSWDYLFKSYWIIVKKKMSLTLNELKEGRNAWNEIVGSDFLPRPAEDGVTKTHEHSEPEIVHQATVRTESCGEKSTVVDGCADWGSRELLEFVSHIKNGDTTVMSRSNVQLLLFDYINSNNLHDPNQENQIVCDEKLTNLFGMPSVGHTEMVKLLDFHFMKNGCSPKKAGIHVGADEHKSQANNLSKASSKIDEDRTPQTNFDDYAAIDVHNISLIFLRRSMIESILGEVENFHEQVVGSIVRIIVPNDGQKPDMHRLVQVVGTSKGPETYQVGDKSTDIMLEVLNLTKKESIQIDAVSDENFSEYECKRLHQGIKFGLVKRLAVEEIQSKAVGLQALKFHDWLAAEILRLNRIRNQAKAKGLDKEVIECTEKLKMLKTPEERQRRLSSIPEVHSDPKMNPSYESEDEEEDKGDGPLGDEGLHENEFGCVSNTCDNKPTGDEGNGCVSNTCDNKPTGDDEGLHENENGCVSNTCDNKQEEDNANGMSVSGNLTSGSETAVKVDSPSIDISETNEIWRYRDPLDRIQGPFSMKELRFWSTTGFFPPDMKTWIGDNEEENSVLVSDALAGKFHKIATVPQKSSELSVGDSNVLDLASPNPETVTENMKTWNGDNEDNEEENSILVSDALAEKFHKVSTVPQMSSELSVTENMEIVPASEENPVDDEGLHENENGCVSITCHNKATGGDEGLHENENGCASNTCDNKQEEDKANGMSVSGNLTSGSDTAITVDSPSIYISETEEIWHYRDSLDRIQGPFSMKELRFWSTAGLFPPDMKTWIGENEEENSVLVSDALAGNFHKVSTDLQKSSELSVDDSNVLDLASPNPETVAENMKTWNGDNEEENSILASDALAGKFHKVSTDPQKSSEISVDDSNVFDFASPSPETVPEYMTWNSDNEEENLILISYALAGKVHEVSTVPQMSSELSVDDSNVLDLASPNLETVTENMEIVPLSEENPVDMEIQANDMNMSIGNDLTISDAPTDFNKNMSSWQGINAELPEDVSDILAEIDALSCGGNATTTDMMDFDNTMESETLSSTGPCPLLEALMDSIFEESDGAAANNPPPTESSSSFIQK